MSDEQISKPIESALYTRQRKSLITIGVLITAINLIGGKLITGEDGSSAFALPFGITIEVARPWLIDWLLLAALIYLLIRYVIFSRYVRTSLKTLRGEYYVDYILKLDSDLKGNGVTSNLVSVENTLWFWKYSVDQYNGNGGISPLKRDRTFKWYVTLLPSLIVEGKLLVNENSYSDYYSPYIMFGVALLSYYFKT